MAFYSFSVNLCYLGGTMCRLRKLKCIDCGYDGVAHEKKCPVCGSEYIYEVPFSYIPERKEGLVDESLN